MSERITLTLSDSEAREIRERAAQISRSAEKNDKWGREALSATKKAVTDNTPASVAYLLKKELGDEKTEDDDGYLH